MYGFRRGSGGAGGSGNVSTLSGGANGRITLWNGATTVTGDPSGTWSGTGHTFVLGSPTFNASDGHFTGPAGASFGPSAAGGGFTNQPAGDTVNLISSDAGDTTQQVTIIGTLAGVDASENIALNGVTPVVSVGTYDLILAIVLNGACAGTVTLRDMAALTITTIAPAALSAGLQTFAAIDGYGKVLQIVADGATTKTVGIGGYAIGGGIQREPVVLTGTTKVNTTNTWEGAVQFYLGDLEATRTVTLNSIAGFDFRSVAGVFGPVEAGSLAASNLTPGQVLLASAATGSTGATSITGDSGCTWTGTGSSFVATFGGGLIVGTEAALFNTFKGANSDGLNLYIGGGGQSSVGGIGTTYMGSRNTFVGYLAGYSNTTGYSNTFNGTQSGFSNTTGYYNTFNGTWAGYSNTTGFSNTFNGTYAGFSNTTGNSNTFNGTQSGFSNTTGYYNTFNGTLAGYANTTGYSNTFNGTYAGFSNTTGLGLVALGYSAGRYELGSNAFYLNNVDQVDTAGDKAYSLLYGTFAGTAGTTVGNTLTVNGPLFVPLYTSGPGKTGTNVAGGNNTIQAEPGTGSATGSSIVLQTPSAGASGATAQTQATRLTLSETNVNVASALGVGVPSPVGGGYVLETSGGIYSYAGGIRSDDSSASAISAPNGGGVFGGPVRLKGYTVATLPAGTVGDTAYCTDLTAPTFMGTAVGGGAVVGKVFYDGTNWITQ